MTHAKRCRLMAGLRQSDVAARAGVSRQTVNMLESGRQRPQLALGEDDRRVIWPEMGR